MLKAFSLQAKTWSIFVFGLRKNGQIQPHLSPIKLCDCRLCFGERGLFFPCLALLAGSLSLNQTSLEQDRTPRSPKGVSMYLEL